MVAKYLLLAGLSLTASLSRAWANNEYASLLVEGRHVASLRVDGQGRASYGQELAAREAGIEGVAEWRMTGRRLELTPGRSGLQWALPFVREGYYDADDHRHYPHATSTADAREMVLPVRHIVADSGQVLRIESLKREKGGEIRLQQGRLLIRSDASQNWDLEVTFPGLSSLAYRCEADRLVLDARSLRQPMLIDVLPRGERQTPGNALLLPEARFEPDFPIVFEPTAKTISASRLLTEFMQQGIYWAPFVIVGGDWCLGAVETHTFSDPRTWHRKQLRRQLLEHVGAIGYDRFGHFGYHYPNLQYPDYGAGGLLNVSPDAPWDVRLLYLNGLWIHSIAQYVLASGDVDFLSARRARWISTDGEELQPLVGKNADFAEHVLHAGDVRLDGHPPTSRHSLGQVFVARASFNRATAKLGNSSKDQPNRGRIALYDAPGGRLLAETTFTIPPTNTRQVGVTSVQPLPPGRYYLEVTSVGDNRDYFAPGVTWWTDLQSPDYDGQAYVGPIRCDVREVLRSMFDYMRQHMGAAETDMIQYLDDRAYNMPQHKSGRHAVSTPNSYWEGAGNAQDAFAAVWYPTACRAMAELSVLTGDVEGAIEYRRLESRARKAYNKAFWHEAQDNGRPFGRYLGCRDWDGKVYDYGFTYYNLEAAARDIPQPQQGREILRWLDHGQYSPDGGKTWRDDIYSIWEVAPPFNTTANSTWLNVTGTMPYLEVLTNGGTRLDVAARDLTARTRFQSVDKMHERNLRILARYASPDRLTGGRTFDDHGGRGRWQFLGPERERLDFEGFREIFPQGGAVASLQPAFYFDMRWEARGLSLRPQVPTGFGAIEFANLNYWGAMLTFRVEGTTLRVHCSDGGPLRFTLRIEDGPTVTPAVKDGRAELTARVEPGRRVWLAPNR